MKQVITTEKVPIIAPQHRAPSSKKVYNLTTGLIGMRSGESHNCTADNCNGLRIRVQWPVGGYTSECTSRMVYQHRKSRDGRLGIEVEAGSWVIPRAKGAA